MTKEEGFCGTDLNHQNLIKQLGERYKKNMLREEQHWMDYASTFFSLPIDLPVVTIPVVVHIVYNTDEQNISDSQVNSQIEALNRDFRKRNTDIDLVPTHWKDLAADTRIEFQLAVKDPQGNLTNGITRTRTDINPFLYGRDENGSPHPQKIKFSNQGGKDAWDTTRYLNIWVCNIESTPRPGIQGYAQFPGGDLFLDGVVMKYTAFGTVGTARPPLNLGRVTVHEVGHYLGLRHIWGDDSLSPCQGIDNISDTPNQAGPNGGNPTFPSTTESCPDTGPNGTMFMNQMDYTVDASRYMFTLGQMARMRFTLEGVRLLLVKSNVLRSVVEESNLETIRKLPPKMFNGIDSVVGLEELL